MKNFQSYIPGTMKSALLCISLLLAPMQLHARDVSFQWTANPEPFTGYKLYYKEGADSTSPYDGSGLNEGSAPITLDKVTAYTVTGLSPDKTYQFVLTAYNETEESGYSTIVTVSPDPFPTIISIVLR